MFGGFRDGAPAPERAGRSRDLQPLPVPSDRAAVQDLVIADIRKRMELGIRRYGTPLRAFNGRDALRDLYEELLDATCYARQAIEERGQICGITPLETSGMSPDARSVSSGSRPIVIEKHRHGLDGSKAISCYACGPTRESVEEAMEDARILAGERQTPQEETEP